MNWNVVWSQSIVPSFTFFPLNAKSTIRFKVMCPLNGEKLRLKLSNRYGKQAYIIGECTVKAGGARCQVTLNREKQFAIPCGEVIDTDAVDLNVTQGENIEISMFYLNRPGEGNSIEESANLVKGANLTQSDAYPPIKRSNLLKKLNIHPTIPIIDAVEVYSDDDPAVIVAFGDSITQQSTWTRPLAAKLFDAYQNQVVLINKGIGGNRILHPGTGWGKPFGEAAKDRLERDVLSIRGVKFVIMALGTNDIGQAKQNSKEYVTAGQISAAMRAMVEKMNESGIRVIGTTVMARLGSTGFKSYHEVTRKELNEWIRSYAGFAHVVDFDRVTEAADRPGWLKAAYDCGDHTHPSSEGGRAMASAINVGMFK